MPHNPFDGVDMDTPEERPAPRQYSNGRLHDEAIWLDEHAWTEAGLPRRAWLANKYALRGAVTVIVGPPSAMKSSLMLAWAVAVALKQPHGDFRPTCAGSVIVYNAEDSQDEQRRRLSAVLRQFDSEPGDIVGKVLRVGPASVGTLFAYDKQTGRLVATPAMQQLRELIRQRRPALLIADPLAELHTAEENDNTALRAVLAEFRALAIEFDMAVVIVHHTRKGALSPGDPDMARGASATIGAARIVLTLCTMSEQDAALFGIAADRKTRAQYVRLDDAKQNYASIGNGEWFEKTLYDLANGEAVPAAVPWVPPDVWRLISNFTANAILDTIDAGLPNGQRYSPVPQAKERAAWPLLITAVPELNEKQARAVIAAWRRNKVLVSRQYHDPDQRHERAGLYVDPARRPG